APSRVRPHRPGRRPAVHRPQRRCPPPLGRRRRARLSPRALRRAGPPSRPRGARKGRSPAAGVGGDLRLRASTPPASRGGGPVSAAPFGLTSRPFGERVAPAAYVALPGHEAVLRRLRYALEQSRAPAVLYGPPGSGKTLLARRLSSQLGRPAVHMTFPAL